MVNIRELAKIRFKRRAKLPESIDQGSAAIKTTVCRVVIHALLPLTLFPFSVFIVPVFALKASELGFELDKWTLLVFDLASFVSSYWYFYILILVLLLAVDAVVLLKLARFNKWAVGFWSGMVVLIEAGVLGVCVWALLRLELGLSSIPWLCPI